MRLARDAAVTLAVGLVIALLQISIPGSSLPRFVGVLLVASIITAAGLTILSSRKAPTSAVSLPPPGTSKEERIFLPEDITPQFLQGFYRQHTEVQADKLAASYKGKWMRVVGTVFNVRDSYTGFEVPVQVRGDPDVAIFLTFDRKWGGHVSILRRDDPIEAVGRIRSIGGWGVNLERCELISAQS